MEQEKPFKYTDAIGRPDTKEYRKALKKHDNVILTRLAQAVDHAMVDLDYATDKKEAARSIKLLIDCSDIPQEFYADLMDRCNDELNTEHSMEMNDMDMKDGKFVFDVAYCENTVLFGSYID